MHYISKNTFDPLTSLRGVACLLVIWFHLRAPISWFVLNGVNVSFLTAPSGWMAVYIFYLLSGYGVGYGFFSDRYTLTFSSLRRYFINRFLRIAPAYYVAALVSIFIFYPHIKVTTFDIFRIFTFTMNVDYLSLPYQRLWIIVSSQMQFYMVAPVLFLILRKALGTLSLILVGLGILMTGIVVRFLLIDAGFAQDSTMFMANIYGTVWGMIDFYLFGMLLSFIVIKRETIILEMNKWIPNWVYIALLVIWFVWVNYVNFFTVSWQITLLSNAFFIPPSLSLLIGWYILRVSYRREYTSKPPSIVEILYLLIHPKTFFYSVGVLSFAVYLYHYAFWEILYFIPGIPNDTWPAFIGQLITITAITLISALASYAFIEYPLLMRKRSR